MALLDVAILFGTAMAVSAFATPIVARVALALGVVDRPNARKVSLRDNMPLMGGIAVALGCWAGLLAGHLIGAEGLESRQLAGFLGGGLAMLVLGGIDDRFGMSATPKFIVQLLAASLAFYCGFRVDYLTGPIIGKAPIYMPMFVSYLLTLLWITAVTNSINLIDGLDGLATGCGAIVAGTLTLLCFQVDQAAGLLLGSALVGAMLGFLPFNFSPARIFLGDTGAYFIGFALSLLALEGYKKQALLTFMVPLLVFAVPFLDTGLSILRRLRTGKGIFTADKHHMHHRLLQSRGTARRAVLSLYFLTGCFCIIALSFRNLDGPVALLILGAVVVLTVRLIRNLGVLPARSEMAGPEEETG